MVGVVVEARAPRRLEHQRVGGFHSVECRHRAGGHGLLWSAVVTTSIDRAARRATNTVDFWYKAVVVRVVDGDTIDVLIRFDVGFRQVLEWTQRVRLARINAPERKRPTIDAGVAATEWLAARIPPGSVVWLATSKGDSFGRYIAEVYDDAVVTDDSRPVNDVMVDERHAVYRTY